MKYICEVCAQWSPSDHLRSKYKLRYQGGAKPFYSEACGIHLGKAVRFATEAPSQHDSVVVTPR